MTLGKAFRTAVISQFRVLIVAAVAGVAYAGTMYAATSEIPHGPRTSVLFSAAPIGDCILRAANRK